MSSCGYIVDLKNEQKSINYLIKKKYFKNLFEICLDKEIFYIKTMEGKCPEFDMAIIFKDNEIITFESKEDKTCHQTGNICIEFEKKSRNKIQPSGLNITQAKYWVEVVHSSIWNDKVILYLTTTDKLKEFINQNDFRVLWGGDKKNSHLCLIPEQKYLTIVTNIISIDRKSYLKETKVSKYGTTASHREKLD